MGFSNGDFEVWMFGDTPYRAIGGGSAETLGGFDYWIAPDIFFQNYAEKGSSAASSRKSAYTDGLRIFPFSEDFSAGSTGDEWSRGNWVVDRGV